MQTVIGAFDDQVTAHQAVERLVAAGFDRDDVHIQPSDSATDRGKISGFFSNLFGGEERTNRLGSSYAEAVRRGSTVVVVDARDEDHAEHAATLLDELGAIDIDERTRQWRASGWKDQAGEIDTSNREGRLDVVQEELKVGKRVMDRGGVRVIQRVSQTPVRELVRLKEEQATVERHAVDRPATAQDMANFREGSFEMRETAEEPVVSKTARVVEEVRLGKEVREREAVVEDTLRRKDVDVERLPEQDRATATGKAGGKDKPAR